MTDKFKKLIEIILENEGGNRSDGGYVTHPKDKGGETKYGIAKSGHPDLNIKALTREQAKEIYWEEYYKPSKVELINDYDISAQVFDVLVGGTGNAKPIIKAIQQKVGVNDDGFMGKDTANAINNYRNPDELHNIIQDARERYYHAVVQRDPEQKVFLKGWLNRIYKTTKKKSVKVGMGIGGILLLAWGGMKLFQWIKNK